MDTCLIRNALAIRPLAAGVAAVDCIRPLGGEDFSAAFADSILPFFQSPLFQIFLITPVPAQTIIAIFLAFDQRVEIPSATLADDFPYNGIWSYTSDFFFIPLSQRFLIFVFPIAVPHGIIPSFHRTGRAKNICPAPSSCLYDFCFLFLCPLLPIPHFTVCFPLTSLAAVFHIVPGRSERFSTVSADTFPLSAFRRLLPVEFRPAPRTTK